MENTTLHAAKAPASPQDMLRVCGHRLLYTLGVATLIGLLNSIPSHSPTTLVVGRAWLVGVVALGAFSLFENWPRKLPSWMARWILQILGVMVAVPLGAMLAYWSTTGGNFDFFRHELRFTGFMFLTVSGIFSAPWLALGAMVRQRDAFARSQKLSFELERSELEREALDARMRLLQAQVQPHFLFNTLANVQALVDTGSPKASQVLGTLIAYLRAAVPRLDDACSTLGNELDLVRSYLELMHMRMPDRLQFSIEAGAEVRVLRCPPLTLMTLVENAVRHGVDPSEDGGRIDIAAHIAGGQCHVRVSDTGVGLQRAGHGLGTGLSALRERLQLSFGPGTELSLRDVVPHGVSVELVFPAERGLP